MKKNQIYLILYHLLTDVLAAAVTWFVFFVFRKYNVDHLVFEHFSEAVLQDAKLWWGLLLCPVYWMLWHIFIGYYYNICRKSRLKELERTAAVTIVGVIIFFFVFILDDIVNSPSDYIKYFLVLLLCQFFLTFFPRVLMTTHINRKIHNGEIGFNTIIIGSDKVALNTYQAVIKQNVCSGNYIVGYVTLPDEEDQSLSEVLTCLGSLQELKSVIEKLEVEELIIAIHNGQRRYVETILTSLREMNHLTLHILPQTQDYLMGTIRMS
ncbi:MAG: hypothetical protein MJZ46_07595, partial [Bacteroidales bacterium]|nr:hypothetical protein [Bacteroidales bacterium]